MNAPDEVTQVALVGAGTIGAGWAAHFLAQGLDVIVSDPGPHAEKKLRAQVDTCWPQLTRLALAENASRERLRFVTSIEAAVEQADFIQESTPEQEAVKDSVIAAISHAAKPDVVIASSTSGMVPTRLQTHCRQPQRLIVGHPFNPVYLVPLVEVVGGEQTAPETIEWAMAFYRHWGKTPLHCRTESPGHIANRLQDAVLTEAMQLIAEGVATTDEVDTALSAGPGIRWALMGPLLTMHMAAGEGGLSDVLSGKFGSTYYSHFQGPQLDKLTQQSMVDSLQRQIAERPLQDLEQIRDEFLVGVLKQRAAIYAKYGFDSSRFCVSEHPNPVGDKKEDLCN